MLQIKNLSKSYGAKKAVSKVDGDRRRQAVIESEKDYQRQCTQNGADNNMLRCGLHKYYLL